MADHTPNAHADEPTPQPEEGLRPEADESVVRPEQEEPNGPVPGLLATASAEAQDELGLADAEDEAQLEAVGVEEEGIEGGQIAGITIAILASVFLIGFVVFWGFYLPELGETEDTMSGEVELGPDQRTILAEGMAALQNYSLTADSTYTMPIDVAMSEVIQAYGGSAADSALAGVAVVDGMPRAMTREGWNVQPVQLAPARAVRAASSRGALTAPVPETGDETPVPLDVATEPGTGEEVGTDEPNEADFDSE